MLKRNLFFLFILIAGAALTYISFTAVKRSSAVMAVVESQKTAISYHKPVTIKAIYVNAGQQVKKGDLLLEVERPDMVLEYDKLINQKSKATAGLHGLTSEYKSKLELLRIETNGKIQRLDAEIRQLETEMQMNILLRANMALLADTSQIRLNPSNSNPDSILLASYLEEKQFLMEHYTTEKIRLKTSLDENVAIAQLELEFIDNELSVIKKEEEQLKKYAPFDGTIGNVNAQLQEILPAFQTIVSLYEKKPSTIKAYINTRSEFVLEVGDEIRIESSTRKYSTNGTVLEIGARIVSYVNPGAIATAPELYGREVFIILPPENEFLYGEQVYIYPGGK